MSNKIIGLGFVRNPGTSHNDFQVVSEDYILDPTAVYEVDIAGKRTVAHPYLHAPKLNNHEADSKEGRSYRPTVVKAAN